jgi:hypothetical protein
MDQSRVFNSRKSVCQICYSWVAEGLALMWLDSVGGFNILETQSALRIGRQMCFSLVIIHKFKKSISSVILCSIL